MIVDTCMVCGSKDVSPYGEFTSVPRVNMNTPFGMLEGNVIVKYVSCLRCGMIWQSPRMTEEQLDIYYSDGHYRNSLGISQDVMDKDEMERSLRIYYEVETLLYYSHLDVGCSRGYLLGLSNERGARVLGIESNLSYVTDEKATAVNSWDGVLGQFDLITMIHVLEHTTDPVMEIVRASNHLSLTGTLLIEVPSTNSKGGPFRLAHTLHMEPHVLVNICERAGLVISSVTKKEHTQIRAKRFPYYVPLQISTELAHA